MPPTPEHLLLSTFEYDTTAANHIQTFPVPRAIQELGIKMGVVIWKFKSNWGSEDYTCLYRVCLFFRVLHLCQPYQRLRDLRYRVQVVEWKCRR